MIDALARVSQSPDSFARLIAEMNGAAIDRAVLFAEHSGVSTSFLAGLRDGDPSRFALVSVVDPLAEDAGRQVTAAKSRFRAAGVEMRPSESGRRWLNVPDVMPLWEKLDELGLCVSLCIASQDYNQFSDVVTTFPTLRVVLEDLGSGPETTLSQYVPILLEYARYPQVHVGISRLSRVSSMAHPYTDLWPVVEEVYRAFGPERLIWGSGYPEVMFVPGGYQSSARLLDEFPFLSSRDRQMITTTNAARLWFSKRPGP